MKMLLLLWTIAFATAVLAQSEPPNCADFAPGSFINNPDYCRAYWYCPGIAYPAELNWCPEGENFNEEAEECDPDWFCEDPPTEEPTDPTDEPTDPTDEPTDPTDEPTDPTDEPTDPTDEPTDPTDEPTDPTDEPTDPTDEPTDPTDETTPEPTTTPETTTTQATTTTPRPPPRNVCEGLSDGHLVNNPTHCRSYFYCLNEVPLPRQCATNLNFNEELQICDRRASTPCSNDDFECPFFGISRWEVIGSCTQYNFCFGGQHRLETCAEGLQFNTDISLCSLEESFECTRELCPLIDDIDDIITYPSENYCDQYYMCYDGSLDLHFCANGTHWNQDRQRCERPEDAQCELATPEPPTDPTEEPTTPVPFECPDGEGLFYAPHPTICQQYFICLDGQAFNQLCSDGLLFDIIESTCVIAVRATCAEGAERSRLLFRRSAVLLHLMARAQ